MPFDAGNVLVITPAGVTLARMSEWGRGSGTATFVRVATGAAARDRIATNQPAAGAYGLSDHDALTLATQILGHT